MRTSTIEPETITAVAYCRVASRHTEDHQAAGDQLERCQQLAAELGTTISRQFADLGQSGNTDERPALRALLDYVAVHQITYVITSDPTRLARNVELQIKLERQLVDLDCTVITGNYDGLTATGVGVAAGNLPIPWDRRNEPFEIQLLLSVVFHGFKKLDCIIDRIPCYLVQLFHLRIRKMRHMKIFQRITNLHRNDHHVLLPRRQTQKVVIGHTASIFSHPVADASKKMTRRSNNGATQ